MSEIKLKRLTLFILEIISLQKGRYIDYNFSAQINDFIDKYYDQNKELFELLFDTDILEKFIKNNFEVLNQDMIIKLVKRYPGFDGYVRLVDEVGYEVDQKINLLVIEFLNYYNELLCLKMMRPITKILQ